MTASAEPHHVFVYGTLQPGCRNAHWASAVAEPQVQPAVLDGCTLHHLGRYPGLVEGRGQVQGHVYSYLPEQLDAVLEKLDELEGYLGPQHPENLYHREVRLVQLAGGEEVPAWVYLYARPLPPGSLIVGGRWHDDLASPQGESP